MVSAAKVLQDLRASAERKPDVVVRLGKPLVESGAVKKLDADGKGRHHLELLFATSQHGQTRDQNANRWTTRVSWCFPHSC